MLADGRQTWQGREFGTNEVDKTLGQCAIVEMSFQFCVGKVTLQRYEMDALLITGRDDEVVELVGLFLLSACDGEVADAQTTLCIVQVVGREVGVDVA